MICVQHLGTKLRGIASWSTNIRWNTVVHLCWYCTIAVYFTSLHVSLVSLSSNILFVDFTWNCLKCGFPLIQLIIEMNERIPEQLFSNSKPYVKPIQIMQSDGFIWLNWLNSQSNWQSLFFISLSKFRAGASCSSVLSCPGRLEGRAVTKFTRCALCKAFPDIYLGRF